MSNPFEFPVEDFILDEDTKVSPIKKPPVVFGEPQKALVTAGSICFEKDREEISFIIHDYRPHGVEEINVSFPNDTDDFSQVENVNLEDYGFDESAYTTEVEEYILEQYKRRM